MTGAPTPDLALNALLDTQKIAPVSDLLQARILAQAKQTPQVQTVIPQSIAPKAPANDRFQIGFGKIAAAVILCFGLGISTWIFQTQTAVPAQDLIWQEAAVDLGVDEIYAWVEGESADVQSTGS